MRNMSELMLEQDRTISVNLEHFTQCHLVLDKAIKHGTEVEEKQDKDTKDNQSLTNYDNLNLDNKNVSGKHLEKGSTVYLIN